MPRKTNPRKTNPSSFTMLGGPVVAGSDRVHLHFPKTVYPRPSPLLNGNPSWAPPLFGG